MQIADSFKFLLLLVYIFLAVSGTCVFMMAFGLVSSIPDHIVLLVIGAITLFCLSGVYWLVPIMTLSMNIRKPTREEEQQLQRCMAVLQRKSGKKISYRLRVIETNELTAFAIGTRTIAISKGLRNVLVNDDKLISVMAHEMAHLMARDTFASTGLLIAFYLPSYIQRVSINLMLNFAARFIKQVIVQGVLASLLGLVMLIGIVYYFHLLSWIMTLFVLGIFFLMLNWFFSLLYLADSRFTEYRRDAYAR